MSARPEVCPSEFALERHLAGEWTQDSPHAAHVSSCARCAARLAVMRSEGAAYMASASAEAVRGELGARDATPSRGLRRVSWWVVAGPIAAAAMLVAVLHGQGTWGHPSGHPSGGGESGSLVPKGAATVELWVGHGGEVVPWTGGALGPGDALQLAWTGARAGYVAVVGREDSGETARWYPAPSADDHAPLLPAVTGAGTQTFGDSLRFDPPFHGTVYVFVGESGYPTTPLETAIREGRAPDFSGQTVKLHIPGPSE